MPFTVVEIFSWHQAAGSGSTRTSTYMRCYLTTRTLESYPCPCCGTSQKIPFLTKAVCFHKNVRFFILSFNHCSIFAGYDSDTHSSSVSEFVSSASSTTSLSVWSIRSEPRLRKEISEVHSEDSFDYSREF